jgi:hypothetical protein
MAAQEIAHQLEALGFSAGHFMVFDQWRHLCEWLTA